MTLARSFHLLKSVNYSLDMYKKLHGNYYIEAFGVLTYVHILKYLLLMDTTFAYYGQSEITLCPRSRLALQHST